LPRGLRARLTIAFLGTAAAALALSGILVVSRIDGELQAQELAAFQVRRTAVAVVVRSIAQTVAGTRVIISRSGLLTKSVRDRFLLQDADLQQLATAIARADVLIAFGTWDADKEEFRAIPNGGFTISSASIEPAADESRVESDNQSTRVLLGGAPTAGAVQITLQAPLSTRPTRIREIGGLIGLVGAVAMMLSIALATYAARRFTRPVLLLSEAAAAIGNGDLSARVLAGNDVATNDEMAALLERFNLMAARLDGTVKALRRERDRGQEHLADVSHELRTPLAALRAFVDLLADEQGTDTATRKRLISEAGRQLERMDALTANILELSRFDAGIARPVFVTVDLRSSVRAAIEQAAAGARRRGVALDERLPARRVVVRHDPNLVGQAVANLVANALKFTPRGGHVSVAVQPLATGAARVVISDDGVGIPSEELPRIFDRFYRGTEGLAAAGRAARASGSGLGLAIVKSIVDMHAGRIVVESLAGRGTKFELTFPADPEISAGEPAEVTPVAESASLISVGRRAAALLGEVAKTSLRLRRVLQAEEPSSTLGGEPSPADTAAPEPTAGERK
jgi:hypothetical protein